MSRKYGCIGGGMLYDNLNPKPSYFALKDLIASWTTRDTGRTNDNGALTFRGFAGDYEVTVETPPGARVTRVVHISEKQTGTVTIEVAATKKESPTPAIVSPDEGKEPAAENYVLIIVAAFGSTVGLLVLIWFFVMRKRRGTAAG